MTLKLANKYEIIIAVFFFILLFSAGFFILELPVLAIQPDSASYLEVADLFIDKGILTASESGNADLYRTPGYPLFLAAVRLVLGPALVNVLYVQVIVLGLQTILLYQAVRLLWDERTALRAAVLSLLACATYFSVFTLLTETLFTFFLTAAFLCTAVFFKKREIHNTVVGGLIRYCCGWDQGFCLLHRG